MPQRLLLGSGVAYATVFGMLVAFGQPGLGVGQGFYLPIVLAALATDAATGAVAGAWALVLYLTAEFIAGREGWSWILSVPISIRLVAYVAAGVTVGWFATRFRGLLAESLRALDDVLGFARRGGGAAPRADDAFEAALDELAAQADPFALLVVDVAAGDDVPGVLATRVSAALPEGSELAQLGRARHAMLVEANAPRAARAAADRLERELGGGVTVGWAFHPVDGDGGLALVAAAVERLQARRIVRGEWTPTRESAGLAER